MREWRSAHPKQSYYSGAAWWRVTFSATEVLPDSSARSLPASTEVAVALSAACGELSAWVNGLPINATASGGRLWHTDPVAPMLMRVPRAHWRLKRGETNTVALRFAAGSTHECAASSSGGAGLWGRVYIVGKV